jgi:hypothetical protein
MTGRYESVFQSVIGQERETVKRGHGLSS